MKKINSRSVAGSAASLFLAAFVIVILFAVNRKTSKYDIVVFGDSRMVGHELTETIPEIIEKETGRRTVNVAFGGSTLADYTDGNRGGRDSLFSMSALSKCAEAGSFRQLIAAAKSDGVYYRVLFPEILDTAVKLSHTDIKSAQIIIIGQGVNDCMASVPVDNPENPFDTKTYGGALRKSVERLKKVSPKAKIVLVTPAYFDYPSESGGDLSADSLPLNEYADKCIEIASDYDLEVADCYYGSGIDSDNCTDYLKDGLHYNDNGAGVAAELILAAIKRAEDKND